MILTGFGLCFEDGFENEVIVLGSLSGLYFLFLLLLFYLFLNMRYVIIRVEAVRIDRRF